MLFSNVRFVLQNDKLEGIHIRTGSRTGNTNLGQNKVVIQGLGISFYWLV